jgi:hypothetical protein
MVKPKTVFLTPVGYTSLALLQAPLRVLRLSGPSETGADVLLPVDGGEYALRLSVDYQDVVFKFEIFGLNIEKISAPPESDAPKAAVIDEWQSMRCLFRFEWERDAVAGEVPAGYEPIVRARGPRSSVDVTATAIGVSMVGVGFWNDRQHTLVAALSADDETPGRVRVSHDREELELLAAECEAVELADFPDWSANVVRFLTSPE